MPNHLPDRFKPTPQVLMLQSGEGLSLTLMNRGATLLSCMVPTKSGERREVLLGCPLPEDYARQSAYISATIGRYPNRIGNARISRGDETWQLTRHPASGQHLHGGLVGFDQRHWTVTHSSKTEARFLLESPSGDQGYPGNLKVLTTYRLVDDMTFEIEYLATVSAPCPVCITNHAYFNLDAVHRDVRLHRIQIAADSFLPVDENLIARSVLRPVQDSSFDFREPKTIARDWLSDEQQRFGAGYDHAFLLDTGCAHSQTPAAVLTASDGSLALQLYTSLPALQLYTGQYLQGIRSRTGEPYKACAGVALEPEFLPDSPNHSEWPQASCWLLPGETFKHCIRYRFISS